jgi:hypothetical protein
MDVLTQCEKKLNDGCRLSIQNRKKLHRSLAHPSDF